MNLDMKGEEMFSRARLASVIAISTVAVGATASAASAMTVSYGSPQLVGRVSINVPLKVTCSPFDPALTLIGTGAGVSVEQAAGQGIAVGSGSTFNMAGPNLAYTCDGTEQTVNVSVLANPSGPPFHGGQAVFNASANANAGQPCFPGSTNCFTNIITQSATTGPTQLHLH
jgi:autotransporter translocation and assembly factor TamB